MTTLLAVYDGNDHLMQRFEYAGGRMPVAMTQGGQKYYLHYDQVGSLRAVSDASHNLVKEITYDTYGNILTDTNPSFKVPFGFAGGLYDSDTGLTHFGYREYDAYTGKWTAKDPIGFAGGDSNLYGYVLGDPVGFVDPWGLYGGIAGISGAKIEVIRHATVIGPYDAYQGAKNADYSLKTTNELIEKGVLKNPLNGSADAFRHCLWSCKMTRSIGKNQAKAFLDDHEEWNYEPGIGRDGISNGASTMMDLNNNFIGQQCANTPRKCEDICLEKALSDKSDLFKIWE